MSAGRLLAGAALVTLSACATSACDTSGKEWVAESPADAAPKDAAPATETVVAEVAAEQEQLSSESQNGLPAAPAPGSEDEGPRPRVITLGETTSGPIEAPANAAAPAESSVQINNNYYGNSGYDSGYVAPYGGYAYPYGYYGGYGAYGRGSHSFHEGSGRGGGGGARPSMQPGQNWPSVPNYGPAFPFNSAPASPWAPAR